jgi:hypothetical protein
MGLELERGLDNYVFKKIEINHYSSSFYVFGIALLLLTFKNICSSFIKASNDTKIFQFGLKMKKVLENV